jgi:hypothetical protein
MPPEPIVGLRRWREALLIGALALLAIVILFAAQQPGVFGLYNDDGDYLKGAEAIAHGYGYLDFNDPKLPQMPRYPIGLPALLAPLAWAFHDWWALVFSAKMLIGAIAIGFVLACYAYLRRWAGASPMVAGLVTALVAVNTAFIEFGTSIMSDLPYAFLAVLTMLAVEPLLEREGRHLGHELLVATMVVATCLVRYAGIALVVAVVVALLHRRQTARLGRVAAMGAVLWLPWALYRMGFSMATNYGLEFLTAQHDSLNSARFWVNASASVFHLCVEGIPALVLPLEALHYLMPTLPPMVWVGLGLVIAAAVILVVWNWLVERLGEPGRSILCPLYVGTTLAMVVVWNSAYTGLGVWQHVRLMLPVLPFLLFLGIRDLDRFGGLRRWGMAAATAGLLLAFAWQAKGVIDNRNNPATQTWDAYEQMTAAVDRLTPKDAVVLTWYPPLYNLLAHRRAIQFPDSPKELIARLMAFPITFIVSSPNYELNGNDRNHEMVSGLQAALPGVLRLVVSNPRTQQELYQINRKELRKKVLEMSRHRRSHDAV